MSRAPAWNALLLGFLTGCESTGVVATPTPIPSAGTSIRYAVRSDTASFLEGRLI